VANHGFQLAPEQAKARCMSRPGAGALRHGVFRALASRPNLRGVDSFLYTGLSNRLENYFPGRNVVPTDVHLARRWSSAATDTAANGPIESRKAASRAFFEVALRREGHVTMASATAGRSDEPRARLRLSEKY
jgi:hypothetical protein